MGGGTKWILGWFIYAFPPTPHPPPPNNVEGPFDMSVGNENFQIFLRSPHTAQEDHALEPT